MRYCGTCGEPLHDDVPSRAPRDSQVFESGAVIGSYKILDVLGEGGMGRVYRAEHVKLGRRVALKMLRSKFSSNPETVRRFFAEARAVNKIAHENIVEVTDFITQDDGLSYYIMELLQGSSLFEEIQKGPLQLDRALHIMIQVANALAVVHEAGIVHRDLKPDNIFLARKGNRIDVVKLLDFGIAKLMDPDQNESIHRTGAGMILGTPTYMSPEQAGGRTIELHSDTYSFGVILYELCTGKAPFTAETYAEILVQHLTTPPARPSSVMAVPSALPPALEQLILGCLEKEAAKRPDTMAEVEDVLRSVYDAIGGTAAAASVLASGASRRYQATPIPSPQPGSLNPPGAVASFTPASLTPGALAQPATRDLAAQPPPSVSERSEPEVPARRRWPIVVGALAALGVAGAVVAYALARGGGGESPATPGAGAPSAAAPAAATTAGEAPAATPAAATPTATTATPPAATAPTAPPPPDSATATSPDEPAARPSAAAEAKGHGKPSGRRPPKKPKVDRTLEKSGVVNAFDE